MSYILINKGLATAYRKTKLAWHTGIAAIELENGDFVLPDRVLPIVQKYNKGLATALSRFPTIENPEFPEYELPD